MNSGYLSAELTATCNALGYYDGQTYHLEPHCAETAKDLIRYLRRDDDTHEIRRFFGNTKIVQTDLLPIIQCHSNNQELFDIALRLLVNLTNPAFLVYKESIPKEKAVHNQYLELVSQLQAAKEAFTQHKPWDAIAEKLSNFLNTEEHLRDDDLRRNIERILIVVRNVLHVPTSDAEARPDNDASIHDQVLWALHQSGMLDLILYIASSPQEEFFYMHILEVICLMVREQSASLLGQAASTRSNEEKDKDSDELLAIRKRESLANQQKIRKYQGMRNFGGTYVIKNMKSTSEKDIIYHKSIQNFNKISLDLEKKKVKIPKNRQPLKCHNVERRSALSVRLILKQFCIEILNAAYNPLMKTIKDSLVRGKTQNNDESYYFNALTFFMEFNRSYKYQVKLVCETLSVESFQFIQKYLEMWHEMMVTDKAKIQLWSSRMHIALKSYKELLYNLAEMDKNQDDGVRESSRVIKSNIFYVIEYREMLLLLMNSYKKPKFSLKYLCDLIETVHIFLKLLENFAKNKKLFVQKKVNRPRKKSNKKSGNQNNQKANMEDLWLSISPELETAIESPVNKEVFPYDAASDASLYEQKISAVKKIQTLLKSGDFEEAVAFLRAAREIWPENDTFGSNVCPPEDELNCFKEVFLADLDTGFPGNEEHAASLSEEEDGCYPAPIEERSFEAFDFFKSFANPRVVYICGLLLQSFELNSKIVNHCIAKMFHRIAWDCKLPSMIFQASIFRSFQRILVSHNPNYKELATLAKFIVRKFVEVSQENKKLLAELLFWKSSKDAYDVEVGYGSYQEKSKAAKIMWEEHEEDELRRLYMEYKQKFPEKEMTSANVVPWITSNLIKERSQRSVAKKLKELHLVVEKVKKKPLWSSEEEDQLRSLFEEYRGTDDPVGHILEKMSDKSRRAINTALLKLNVVQDRSELKPKKKIQRKKSQNAGEKNETEESESSSDEEDSRFDLDEERLKQREALDRPRLSKSIFELITFSSTNQYLVGGLEWLLESMKDNVDDCEEDPAEVPLLPLSESSIKSVDDKLFQNFLLSLGLFSPFQQQEMYWRFPSTWNGLEYAKRMELVTMVVDHCKADSHQLSTDLKEFIYDKFGERIYSSDNDQDASDEEMNTIKNDFNSLVTHRYKDALNSYASSPVKNSFDNLLYSRSDDESHKETSEKSVKRATKGKNKKLSGNSEDRGEGETNKSRKNPFMSKVKQLAQSKIKLDNFTMEDGKETISRIKNKPLLDSDSESDKENDTNNEMQQSRNNSPLRNSVTKSKKSRILLKSDDSDSDNSVTSTNLAGLASKDVIKHNKDSDVASPNAEYCTKLDNSDNGDLDNSEKLAACKSSSFTVKSKRNRLMSDSDNSEGGEKIESTAAKGSSVNTEDSQAVANSVQKRPRISLDSDEEESQSNSITNKKRHIIESDED